VILCGSLNNTVCPASICGAWVGRASREAGPWPRQSHGSISRNIDKVAIGSYIVSMKTSNVKSVGVKKLKDQLSAYLREVKNGTVVLVTDRDNVIAEIRTPSLNRNVPEYSSLEHDLIQQGILIPPQISAMKAPRSPLTMKPGTAGRILDEDRGE